LGHTEPQPRGGRRDEKKVIQHCAFCLSNTEAIYQLSLTPTGQAIGQQGGALGALLGGGGKSRQEPDGPEITELCRYRVKDFRLCSLSPR